MILIQEHHKHKVMKRNATKCFWHFFPLCCGSRPTKACSHKEKAQRDCSSTLSKTLARSFRPETFSSGYLYINFPNTYVLYNLCYI